MLRHFFNDFMTFVPLQLPQLLDVTTMEEAQFYGDYALLTFPLRAPYDLEEVMDLFEDDMELITLYHHIPTHADKFGHSTCAYSNPAFGQMFKMNCKTDADGKVNSILVTIYDSLEQMYGELCLDLDLHSKSGTFKYKKNKDDLSFNGHVMRDTLYRQMVYWIREYRTWIEVVDDNFYKEYALSRNGYINYIVSRTLVLRVYKDKGSYAKGMTWTIPEHKLDKALAAYRKQEHTFKQRIKKAAIYLSPRDAEVIILLATHNIVQLELMISPIQIREKPYYL